MVCALAEAATKARTAIEEACMLEAESWTMRERREGVGGRLAARFLIVLYIRFSLLVTFETVGVGEHDRIDALLGGG